MEYPGTWEVGQEVMEDDEEERVDGRDRREIYIYIERERGE